MLPGRLSSLQPTDRGTRGDGRESAGYVSGRRVPQVPPSPLPQHGPGFLGGYKERGHCCGLCTKWQHPRVQPVPNQYSFQGYWKYHPLTGLDPGSSHSKCRIPQGLSAATKPSHLPTEIFIKIPLHIVCRKKKKVKKKNVNRDKIAFTLYMEV